MDLAWAAALHSLAPTSLRYPLAIPRRRAQAPQRHASVTVDPDSHDSVTFGIGIHRGVTPTSIFVLCAISPAQAAALIRKANHSMSFI